MRTHPKRKKITARKSYVKNRDVILKRNKKCRQENGERWKRAKRLWYERNSDRLRAYSREYGRRARKLFKTLPECKKRHIRDIKLRAAMRYYRKYRAKVCQKARERSKRDRVKLNAVARARIHADVKLQIRQRLTTRLKRAFKGQGRISIQRLIGCTWDELKIHIESQFCHGMNWANRAQWHIDHIIPCAAFDLRNAQDQIRCFHYTNLQPLWAADNIRKGAKILR